MRVAVCVDPMCGLTSSDAGTAIARAFAAQGDQCVVVPVGQTGRGAAEALADLLDASPQLLDVPGADIVATAAARGEDAVLAVAPVTEQRPDSFGGSSWPVGAALNVMLSGAGLSDAGVSDAGMGIVRRVWVDPGPTAWHDGGAGFLAALGARPDGGSLRDGVDGLVDLKSVDLAPVRELVAGRELVLLVPEGVQTTVLSGLRGVTSVVGHDRGAELATMLATDARLAGLAAACRATEVASVAGAGASGGLGFAVLLLGGRVTTGFDACRSLAGLDRALAVADLVVTGCDQLDFGHWDQFSVLPIARLVDSRVPVVAINRRTHVSHRELRTQMVESAHSLADADDQVPTSAQITQRVTPIAASWHH